MRKRDAARARVFYNALSECHVKKIIPLIQARSGEFNDSVLLGGQSMRVCNYVVTGIPSTWLIATCVSIRWTNSLAARSKSNRART